MVVYLVVKQIDVQITLLLKKIASLRRIDKLPKTNMS